MWPFGERFSDLSITKPVTAVHYGNFSPNLGVLTSLFPSALSRAPQLSCSPERTQVLPVLPEPAFPAASAIPFGADALGVGPEALVLSLPPHVHVVVSRVCPLCLRLPCPSVAQATLFTGAFQGSPASACVRSTWRLERAGRRGSFALLTLSLPVQR